MPLLGGKQMEITVVFNDEAHTSIVVKGDHFHDEDNCLYIFDPSGKRIFVSPLSQILFAGVMTDVK
jgi:hypothetical protein